MIQNPADKSSTTPQGSSNHAVRPISGNEIVAFDMPLVPEEPACVIEPITEDLSKLLIEPVAELPKQHRGEISNAGERTRMKKRLTPSRLVAPPATTVPRRLRVTRKLISIAGAMEQSDQLLSPLSLPPPRGPQGDVTGQPQAQFGAHTPNRWDLRPDAHMGTSAHVGVHPAGISGIEARQAVVEQAVVGQDARKGTSLHVGGRPVGMDNLRGTQAQQESDRLASAILPAPTQFHQVQQALISPSPSPQLSPHNWERRPWERPDRDVVFLLLIGLMALGILGGTVSGYLLFLM